MTKFEKFKYHLIRLKGIKVHFKVIQDADPAAGCEEEWLLTAKWVKKRWGFYRTQQSDFFFLYAFYFAW